ncbi:hypothetical protein SLE2022_024410 [Rubroshorea leprosula]
MDSDDDFTFCQVALPSDDSSLEAKNLATDVGGISIRDQVSNGSASSQNSGSQWKNKLPDNSTFKEASADVGNSVRSVREPKVPARKPITRAKVPFEKGYSQMDWLKLTRTHPDLAGLKGQSNKRLISMNEVKQHQTEGSMWTVLKGRVYNLSPYMKFHPGGVDMLMKAVGKDCTSLFNKYHAWVNFEFLLEKCLVGTLDNRNAGKAVLNNKKTNIYQRGVESSGKRLDPA